MEMKFYSGQRTLPESWANQLQQEKLQKHIKETLRKANDAYISLRLLARKSFGGNNLPSEWRGFNDKWLTTCIDARENSVGAMPLTESMIQNLINQWEAKRKEASLWVKELGALSALELSGAKIREDTDHRLICDNKEELIDNISKVKVDKTAAELWRLLQNARESYAKVLSFCKDNDLKEIPPSDVMRKDDPQLFVQSYMTGFYSLHPSKEMEQRQYDEICRQSQHNKRNFLI